jgi:hypothetical protein
MDRSLQGEFILDGVAMDVETELRILESRYRDASSGAVAAKARYLALCAEPSATARDIERARTRWETCESRKRTLAARMGEMEELDLG